MAGVRPVIASGKGLNPSQESREHSIWQHEGMVCVAGGKLTTFRLIALDALQAAGLIGEAELKAAKRSAEPLFRHKLAFPHRLGHPALPLPKGEALLETIEWVLDNEMVLHLDDLLLRRVRLGNTMPAGGKDILPQIRSLCQSRARLGRSPLAGGDKALFEDCGGKLWAAGGGRLAMRELGYTEVSAAA